MRPLPASRTCGVDFPPGAFGTGRVCWSREAYRDKSGNGRGVRAHAHTRWFFHFRRQATLGGQASSLPKMTRTGVRGQGAKPWALESVPALFRGTVPAPAPLYPCPTSLRIPFRPAAHRLLELRAAPDSPCWHNCPLISTSVSSPIFAGGILAAGKARAENPCSSKYMRSAALSCSRCNNMASYDSRDGRPGETATALILVRVVSPASASIWSKLSPGPCSCRNSDTRDIVS
jgi:hypothetical protein